MKRRSSIGRRYTSALLLFNLAGFYRSLFLQRFQGVLPVSILPAMGAVGPELSFNTAVSFMTNTNWQNYGGESTMSYLVQMAGSDRAEFRLGRNRHCHCGRAYPRLCARLRQVDRQFLGRYDQDHALHPAADLHRPDSRLRLSRRAADARAPMWMPRRSKARKQTIAVGPVASQLAIKMLGTNGGGFFNANSAHPFENPDAISNLIQMVTIFAIGAAFTNVFGRMVGNQRQGWAIFATMGMLFVAGVVV